MDPAWASIAIGIVSSIITAGVMGAIGFSALKAWMARREEREAAIKEDVADHESRIRYLERQPMDYVPR